MAINCASSGIVIFKPKSASRPKPESIMTPMIMGERADANTETSMKSALISPINRVPYISAMSAALAVCGIPIARPKKIKNNGTPMSTEPNKSAAQASAFGNKLCGATRRAENLSINWPMVVFAAIKVVGSLEASTRFVSFSLSIAARLV